MEQLAGDEDVDLEFRRMNLVELRSVLAESARVARTPGRTVVTAQHVADATDKVGRALPVAGVRDDDCADRAGRLYLQVLTGRGEEDAVAREEHLRPLRMVTARRGASRAAAAPWSGSDSRGSATRAPGAHAGSDDWWSNGIAERPALAGAGEQQAGCPQPRPVPRRRAGARASRRFASGSSVLEDEVQECRQLNLRLAELTDVVQELLLPVAQRDEKAISAALEKYSEGL